jgi:hypothetical protein
MRFILLFIFSFTLMHTQVASAEQGAHMKAPMSQEDISRQQQMHGQDDISHLNQHQQNQYVSQMMNSREFKQQWRSAPPHEKIQFCEGADQVCKQNGDKNSCGFYKKECRNKDFK